MLAKLKAVFASLTTLEKICVGVVVGAVIVKVVVWWHLVVLGLVVGGASFAKRSLKKNT